MRRQDYLRVDGSPLGEQAVAAQSRKGAMYGEAGRLCLTCKKSWWQRWTIERMTMKRLVIAR